MIFQVFIVLCFCFLLYLAWESLRVYLSYSWNKVTDFKKVDLSDYEIKFESGQKVRGSCTVWHTYPGGYRLSTSCESRMADIWQKLEWGQTPPQMNLELAGFVPKDAARRLR